MPPSNLHSAVPSDPPEVPARRPVPAAVVAGHICLDLIPDLSRVASDKFPLVFKPSRVMLSGPMTFATGGAASNTGQALARLGIPVRIVARIGRDPFGEIVRGVIRRNFPGLEAGLIVTADAPTSYTVIVSAPGVDRSFLHFPGANETFIPTDIAFQALEGAALFHFGYPPTLREFYRRGGGELAGLFRRARQAGAITSLDLALPDPASPSGQVNWTAILAEALPQVDIFLPSLEETLFMLRRDTYDALQAAAGGGSVLRQATPGLLHSLTGQMLEMGVKIAGLKLGERGMYLRTAGAAELAQTGRGIVDPGAWAGQELWAPAYRVEVAGTTGAGDAAIAGFLGGLLRGLGPRESLRAAVAVGACCVEAPDSLSGLKDWEATQARASSNWPQHPLDLPAGNGYQDETTGAWVLSDTTGTIR